MKIDFFAKSILLKHYEESNKKKYPQHIPGSTKFMLYAGKSTKRELSKKALAEIEKKKIVLGSYESLERLEG